MKPSPAICCSITSCLFRCVAVACFQLRVLPSFLFISLVDQMQSALVWQLEGSFSVVLGENGRRVWCGVVGFWGVIVGLGQCGG